MQHLLRLTRECVLLKLCAFGFLIIQKKNAKDSLYSVNSACFLRLLFVIILIIKKSSHEPQSWSCLCCLQCAKFTLSPTDGAISLKQGRHR